MKPMHAQIISVNRCPCCHSKYTRHGAYKTNEGKSAARNFQKREIQREIRDLKN